MCVCTVSEMTNQGFYRSIFTLKMDTLYIYSDSEWGGGESKNALMRWIRCRGICHTSLENQDQPQNPPMNRKKWLYKSCPLTTHMLCDTWMPSITHLYHVHAHSGDDDEISTKKQNDLLPILILFSLWVNLHTWSNYRIYWYFSDYIFWALYAM